MFGAEAARAAGYQSTWVVALHVLLAVNILAALLIRTYLFAHQQPMLVMFLDELHIPHQSGVISDQGSAVPDADAVRAAADRIRTAFPAEDVQLYLSALLASDAVAWANLGAAFTDAALTDEET